MVIKRTFALDTFAAENALIFRFAKVHHVDMLAQDAFVHTRVAAMLALVRLAIRVVDMRMLPQMLLCLELFPAHRAWKWAQA